MSATDLLNDGSIVLRALARPGSGFSAVAQKPRAGVALALATALALVAAAFTVPRTDFGTGERTVEPRADGQPPPEPTQHEREENAASARKLGALLGFAGAATL